MKIISKFFEIIKNIIRPATHLKWYYIQCDKCNTPIKIMVNINTDLNYTYDDIPGIKYILKKEAMDSKCFSKININIQYDSSKNPVNKEIIGGKFISETKYAKMLNYLS